MVLEFATRVADSSFGSKWHHFCHVSAEDAKSSLARSRTLFERIVHRPVGIGNNGLVLGQQGIVCHVCRETSEFQCLQMQRV